MKTLTKEYQDSLNAASALQLLKEGNKRFLNSQKADRSLSEQVKTTSGGQFPFAVVLSCIDSRVPVEHVFDLGIGDIFSTRVAGNVINEDVLGSMEYACKVAGSKVVLVMGHSKCGAVTSACKGVELGNITSLLSKIQPAVDAIENPAAEVTSEYVEKVNVKNVQLSLDKIREKSAILSEMEKNGEIQMVGAVYHVESGEVTFL